MEDVFTKTQIIILAGGKSTRMESEIPKVLLTLGKTTMIQHLLDQAVIKVSKLKPIIVIGYKHELVREALGGDKYIYAHQEEQLGTGHAVSVAIEHLDPNAEQVVVLYGDMPLLTSRTIRNLAEVQNSTSNPVTMLSTELPDYDDWRFAFFNWGRVIRNKDNEIEAIVEKKDATSDQVKLTEVTSAHFAFDVNWLSANLPLLTNQNASHEYYLTSLPGLAWNEGYKIQSVLSDPNEVLGANTREELAVLQQFV